MQICRDALQQTLRRLSNRLLELGAWRDRESLRITAGEFRVDGDSAWEPIQEGDQWPIQSVPVEFRFGAAIPKHWAGHPVYCRFRLGGEALLFRDGQPVAGLNPFHEEHPILNPATGGEQINLSAQAVPHGLFGTPTDHRFELAALLIPDVQIRSLYHDLVTSLEAARYHLFAGRPSITQAVLDAVHKAFTRISLPRSETDPYFARLAVNQQSRSAENFYGNEESLASLWERWDFPSPPASVTAEQRQELQEAQDQFNQDLERLRTQFPPEGGIWLTGHAHIDVAWLWPLEETRRKARRTFHSVTGLMERYPEFHFNQSSAQLYSWIEEDDPALFEKIRKEVETGRWEIVGGMWVEPDGNLPGGESWVRQLLFGQRYFENRFGRRARVAWLPDSFGFTGGLPQLLLSAGLPFFFTHKLTWNETNPFPHDLYWWEGIDGSRVLAHSFMNPDTGYNARMTAEELGETWRNFGGKRVHDFSLLAFGYGNGGGGPSAEMLERFARFRNFPGLPRLKIGRVTEFYEAISTRSLPVWVGEQYLEYHRATFTTQAKIKALHRRLEHALVEAETAATLAHLQRDLPYPQDELQRLWRVLLLNEFHDILPGSSIHTVYEVAHQQLASALDSTDRLREAALGSAGPAKLVPEQSSAEFLVWNLQFHDRPLSVEITADQPGCNPSIAGRELPVQRLGNGRLLVSAGDISVPALGALTLRWLPQESDMTAPGVHVDEREMENETLRVRLNTDGTLASIYDKSCGREILAGRANQLWLYTDIPRQFEAWDIDASYADEGVQLLAEGEPVVMEKGPLRGSLRVLRRYDGIEIVHDYRLSARSRLVEICCKIRWCGRRRLLRALFPLEIRTHEVWAETAFGAVSRPTHRNTPWDQARFEMPAHRWMDLSEPGYGVSLLNNGKYGHSVQGNVLGISLLRSSVYPDPYADEGDHEFIYAVYSHPGDWRQGTVQAAQELHSPLRVTPAVNVPAPNSLFRFEQGPLSLACLKKSEDSEDVILRLYEPHGNRGQTVLQTALPLRRVTLVNVLEDDLAEITVENESRIRFGFRPFQVISLRLSFA